uniref:Sema domain-containing protein n=1 Tax=Anguilla anguilla TaxID=7936 RepID=A0A0E9UPF7_ANGAN
MTGVHSFQVTFVLFPVKLFLASASDVSALRGGKLMEKVHVCGLANRKQCAGDKGK